MRLKNIIVFVILILTCCSSCFGFLEIAAGISAYIYHKVACFRGDCCTVKEIPAKLHELEASIKNKLFGQPLVESTVMKALKSHWNHKPTKALTLSFHGGPGIGKNYVSKFISDALYTEGMKSPHVHNFVARLHFPEASEVNVYKRELARWIIGNVSNCPKQLFIFDEVNSMPPGLLDILKPFIDYVDYISRVNYKEAIFIFLSNTGSQAVQQQAYELWRNGIDRNQVKLEHFEKVISQGAFNEEGGFYESDTIRSNLIDHYIPFLPLMEPHIRSCIKEEFSKRGIHFPTEKQISEVLEFIDWGPEPDNVFAKTGCKRISQKVGLLSY